MNRIYLRHIYEIVGSHRKCRTYLSYLKIRSFSAQNCGGFTIEGLSECLGLSMTSTRKHLANLIGYGYVKRTANPKHYRTVSHRTVSGSNGHEKYTHISDEELESYTWKNFSSFRAYLCEIRIQINRRYRKFKRRGYATTDRHGVRERVRSRSDNAFDTLMAGTYVASMVGVSRNTAYGYRRKQKVSTYTRKRIVNADWFPTETGSISIKGIESVRGKIIHNALTGDVKMVPISERRSTICIKGF